MLCKLRLFCYCFFRKISHSLVGLYQFLCLWVGKCFFHYKVFFCDKRLLAIYFVLLSVTFGSNGTLLSGTVCAITGINKWRKSLKVLLSVIKFDLESFCLLILCFWWRSNQQIIVSLLETKLHKITFNPSNWTNNWKKSKTRESPFNSKLLKFKKRKISLFNREA